MKRNLRRWCLTYAESIVQRGGGEAVKAKPVDQDQQQVKRMKTEATGSEKYLDEKDNVQMRVEKQRRSKELNRGWVDEMVQQKHRASRHARASCAVNTHSEN